MTTTAVPARTLTLESLPAHVAASAMTRILYEENGGDLFPRHQIDPKLVPALYRELRSQADWTLGAGGKVVFDIPQSSFPDGQIARALLAAGIDPSMLYFGEHHYVQASPDSVHVGRYHHGGMSGGGSSATPWVAPPAAAARRLGHLEVNSGNGFTWISAVVDHPYNKSGGGLVHLTLRQPGRFGLFGRSGNHTRLYPTFDDVSGALEAFFSGTSRMTITDGRGHASVVDHAMNAAEIVSALKQPRLAVRKSSTALGV